MILNFKLFIYLVLISLGAFLIYFEYEKIIKSNIKNFENGYVETFSQENKADERTFITNSKSANTSKEEDNFVKLIKQEVIVSEGENFSLILKKFNLSDRKIFEIIKELEEFFNLRKLKINQKINFYLNTKSEVVRIEIYDSIDSLLVININDKITVQNKQLEKKLFKTSKEFIILESLYSDGLKNNIPQKILIDLIKLFSFDLDFQRDIRVNTQVSISYDYIEIKENNKIQYKDINYALISIDGNKLEYFKFLTDDGYIDYFNREGKNVKKSILKTPLDGARISSNFGMRKHPISGYNKMHKGVDFAAPTGTPIYAGGNGIIEFVGTNGGYGKYIRIRHNNEYKTAYAHLSKYKKGISKGVRVNQGDIIGFVGNTGNSTGPHLHYEIIYQNQQINPLKLKLPSGKVLVGDELKRFKKEYKRIFADHLNLLFE